MHDQAAACPYPAVIIYRYQHLVISFFCHIEQVCLCGTLKPWQMWFRASRPRREKASNSKSWWTVAADLWNPGEKNIYLSLSALCDLYKSPVRAVPTLRSNWALITSKQLQSASSREGRRSCGGNFRRCKLSSSLVVQQKIYKDQKKKHFVLQEMRNRALLWQF